MFADLGTHVFYKVNQARPQQFYKFELTNVMGDGIEDDYDDYNIKLADGLGIQYFQEDNQDNAITLSSLQVPKQGENVVRVSSSDLQWLDMQKKFFALPKQSTVVEVPLLQKLKQGEFAIVLTWQEGVSIIGSQVSHHNLDLHIEF